jgi:hypothetical protein
MLQDKRSTQVERTQHVQTHRLLQEPIPTFH